MNDEHYDRLPKIVGVVVDIFFIIFAVVCPLLVAGAIIALAAPSVRR